VSNAVHHQQGGWSDIHAVSLHVRALAADAALLPFRARVRLSLLAAHGIGSGALRRRAALDRTVGTPIGQALFAGTRAPARQRMPASGLYLPQHARNCWQPHTGTASPRVDRAPPKMRITLCPTWRRLAARASMQLTHGRRWDRRLASKRSRRTHSDSNATRRPRHIFSKVLHIETFLL
jgi:hypothetical protein